MVRGFVAAEDRFDMAQCGENCLPETLNDDKFGDRYYL